LLTAREVERTGNWPVPLSYFAFWTVRLGGYLPQMDRCSNCGAIFGAQPAFHAKWDEGLLCDKCRRPGMKPLSADARSLAGRYAGEKLDKFIDAEPLTALAKQLREAALNWIENHTERKLNTRELLETP
jgi:recombinational DNA repair protein (RecF pathway)